MRRKTRIRDMPNVRFFSQRAQVLMMRITTGIQRTNVMKSKYTGCDRPSDKDIQAMFIPECGIIIVVTTCLKLIRTCGEFVREQGGESSWTSH